MTQNRSTRPAPDRLLRINEVLQLIPVSRASFYEGIRLGIYPQPVRIGKRTVAWRESEITALIDSFQQGRPPAAARSLAHTAI